MSICSESLARRFTRQILTDTHNSDHFPIVVSIPGTMIERHVKNGCMTKRIGRLTAETIRPDVERDVESFTEKIIVAAKRSIPRSSGCIGPKAIPWWCSEVKTVIRWRRKCLRALRRLQRFDPNQPEALASFKEAKAAAKKMVN